MTHYYDDGQARFYHGDVLGVLAQLPDASVQTVVTSPPYWGLRDYGTAQWEGGEEGCDHKRQSDTSRLSSGLGGATTTQGGVYAWGSACGKCGAKRIDAQLGLEATPEEYVERMVAVFREVRRVLADDGTVWLNLGDSYTGNYKGGVQLQTASSTLGPKQDGLSADNYIWTKAHPARSTPNGLKPKDLVGIPWRVAFALQADGWYLRSDIIWAKPNPMPESVTDRPTKAHEYVFLLSKRERYYWDADAVREPEKPWLLERKDGWMRAPKMGANRIHGHSQEGVTDKQYAELKGANTRTVWTIATEPYPDAHFAVFPSELPRRCILAGSREGDTVLDPFLGSGTTAMVAKSLGRRTIGIDLSETYLDLAVRRCRQLGLFTSEAAG